MGNCHKREFIDDEGSEQTKEIEDMELIKYKNVNKDTFVEYLDHTIGPAYCKDIKHFKETYRIKKNIKCQNDLIYKIKLLENTRSGRLFNVKIIKKSEIIQIGVDKFKSLFTSEMRALKAIKYPNVESLINVYYEKKGDEDVEIYIVTNYTSKYSLLDEINQHIDQKRRFKDEEISIIMKSLIETVYQFQAKKIVHRSLTPDNIFFLKEGNYSTLCIRNFYLCGFCENEAKLRGLTGPLWYMAPEMLQDSVYDYKVDVWSLGVIFYMLLTLENPFTELKNRDEMVEAIKGDKCFKKIKYLKKIGINTSALNLTFQMLIENKDFRISSEMIIEDKFFKENIKLTNLEKCGKFIQYNWKDMDRLKFKIENLPQLHSVIFFLFYGLKDYFMDVEEIIEINQFFNFLDKNHDGQIITSEMKEVFQSHKTIFPEENSEVYLELYDAILDNDFCNFTNSLSEFQKDSFSYEYFLTANIIMKMFHERKKPEIKKKIELMFLELDLDKSDTISIDEMQAVFKDMINKSYVRDTLISLKNNVLFKNKQPIEKYNEMTLEDVENFLFYEDVILINEEDQYMKPDERTKTGFQSTDSKGMRHSIRKKK